MFKQVLQARILQVLNDYVEGFENDFSFNLSQGNNSLPILAAVCHTLALACNSAL